MLASLLVFALPLASAQELLAPEEERALRQGLAWMGVDEVDLAFDKDEINLVAEVDAWRVGGVEQLLREPLRVPADAQAQVHAVLASEGAVDGLLAWGFAQLAVPPSAIPEGGVVARLPWALRRELGPELAGLVAGSLGRLRLLRAEVQAALPPQTDAVLDWQLRPVSGRVPVEVEQLGIAQDLQLADATDRARLFGAALEAARLAQELEEALAGLPADQWPERALAWEGVVIGSPGADLLRVEGPVLLALDPGGDDDLELHWDPRMSVLVDLGGDDVHRGAAAGRGGVGIALDAAGDDRWLGEEVVQGGAYHGVGVLLDRSGNDLYDALEHAQGAAHQGLGLLVDLDGDDRYRVGSRGQAYGSVQGIGLLWDRAGRDLYTAGGTDADFRGEATSSVSMAQGAATGARHLAGGGLGLLLDEAGDDGYSADRFAQGSSYWFARGYLVDLAGSDLYRAQQYAQGCGVHSSVGGLFDLGGDDTYGLARLGQGGAHDYSVAWLVDHAGEDRYLASEHTAQGVGLSTSVAFFVEGGGDDRYRVMEQPERARGGGNFQRRAGSLVLSVDLGGADQRDEAGPAEGTVRRPWAWGAAFDLPLAEELPEPPAPVAPPALPELGPAPAPYAELPLLEPGFLEGWLAAYPHREASAALEYTEARALESAAAATLFVQALPVAAWGRSDVGTRLGALVARIDPGSPEAEQTARALREALASQPWALEDSRLPGWLVKLGAPGDAPLLVPLLGSELPRMRRAGIGALARLGGSLDVLHSLAERDPAATVRASAVFVLAAEGASLEQLAAWVIDDNALVRFNAADALLAWEDREAAREALRSTLRPEGGRGGLRRLQLELLLRLGDEGASGMLEGPWEALLQDPARLDAPWRHMDGNRSLPDPG